MNATVYGGVQADDPEIVFVEHCVNLWVELEVARSGFLCWMMSY